jgi:RNA polymerase primary sigma factor
MSIIHTSYKKGRKNLKIADEPKLFELIDLEDEITRSKDSNMGSDLLTMYLKSLSEIKLLTKDEEIELSRRITMAKDSEDEEIIKLGKEARVKMIESNLRLVVSVAKKYFFNDTLFMDLIQDGTMGLMKAVDRFEADRGYKFSTYATWWIRQSITSAIPNNYRTIRLPVFIHDAIRRVKKVRREYLYQYGEEPDTEKILKIARISKNTLAILNLYDDHVFSLDKKINKNVVFAIEDTYDDVNLSPDENDKIWILEEYANSVLNTLSDREKMVIQMRFGFDTDEKTLEEIGNILGITRERVRQIQKNAIKKIRKIYFGSEKNSVYN